MGNIVWYYDPVANAFPSYAPSLVPGGTVLLLGGKQDGVGARTRSGRSTWPATPCARRTSTPSTPSWPRWGSTSITDFNHDAQRLPNGDTAVLATTPRTINVKGTPTAYDGRHGPRPGPELPGGVGLGSLRLAERPPPPHAGRGPGRLDARELHRLVAGGREPGRLPALPGLGDQDRLRQRDGRRPRHLAAGAGRRFPDQFHGPIPVVLAPARRALYQRHDAGAVRQREHPPQQEPASA